MSIFTDVKDAVSMQEAASFYGIKVGRNKMACCPFHPDKHPSMKVDNRFHCFGCGADGDVINFVERLCGLAPLDAAKKLISDFNLNIEVSPSAFYKAKAKPLSPEQIQKNKEQEQLRAFQLYRRDALNFLHEYYYLLHCAKRDFVPETPEELENCHPLFEEALNKIDWIDYLIEELENGTLDKQIQFLKTYGEVIQHVRERVAEINSTNAFRRE